MLVGAASSPDSIRAKRSPPETGAPNPLMNEDCTFGDARPRKFQVLHTGKAVLLIIEQSPGLLFCDLILNRPVVILTTPLIPQADLCRLGRDYIGAGKYTDMVFPSLGCRFIALNDGVDTIHKNNEMLVILKNMMNDLYARDTSNKIRAVKRSPFKTGKYVECYAPIGCRKSAEDKRVLEIDPITAPVVRRILDMHLQDDSFRKIARTLNKERVPSPRNFYYMAEGKSNLRGETPYWNDVTVKTIF